MKVSLTLVSRNLKTGPIPVSTTSNDTCPDSCPFNGSGCYAQTGPLAMWWRRVSNGTIGMSWKEFCAEIKKLPRHTLWRHNQAGDLPGKNESVDSKLLAQLVEANRGRNGFTYTHKYNVKANLKEIKRANDNGFAINLSANSVEHADKLVKLKVGPVVCVLPIEVNGRVTRSFLTPKGNKVVICPATYMDRVTCASCKLCQKSNRSAIVGFPAHGTRKRMVSQIASA